MKAQIQQKEQILNDLEASYISVTDILSNISAELACKDQNGKWTIAQQFKHLILSTYPVASALKKPYERLAAFGAPTDSTMDYDTLKSTYYGHLAKGVKAIGKFVPEEILEDDWPGLFKDWALIGKKFQDRLAVWSEADLDKYAIPHPILGALSVRQMLLFTILHNHHHLNGINNDIRNST